MVGTEPSRTPISQVPELKDLSRNLDEDIAAALQLTAAEILYVKNALEKNKKLSSNTTSPLICIGESCVYKNTCPLLAIKKHPLGKQCPIESTLMEAWKDQYLKNSSLDINWEDKLDRQAVLELVEIDILMSRVNAVLADNPDMTMQQNVGVDASGEVITQRVMHVSVNIKDLLWKRRERLLKSMVATAEMRRKLGAAAQDPTRREADIIERVRLSKKRSDDQRVQEAQVVSKKTAD